MIGTTELLLIGGIALLLFGGKKLPEMMRGLGQGVREFKNGMTQVNPDNAEQELAVSEQPEQPADADDAAQPPTDEQPRH